MEQQTTNMSAETVRELVFVQRSDAEVAAIACYELAHVMADSGMVGTVGSLLADQQDLLQRQTNLLEVAERLAELAEIGLEG